jgi:hypothetical protein
MAAFFTSLLPQFVPAGAGHRGIDAAAGCALIGFGIRLAFAERTG